MIHLLWDTALLSSGFSLQNPAALSPWINRMVEVALDVVAQLEELLPIIPHTTTSAGWGESVDSSELWKLDDVDLNKDFFENLNFLNLNLDLNENQNINKT
jgi:hypothetical protein